MIDYSAKQGLNTMLDHYAEGGRPYQAHVMPIYQNSPFSFPD